MKRIINVGEASNLTGIALLIARIGIAGLMLTHGIPKLLMLFSGGTIKFPPVFGMSPELSLALTVFAEVFCSLFILFGFATRAAAAPLAITMVVAAFMIHAADPLTVKESALHYLLVYIVLLFAGSGRYSIDYLLQRKNAALSYATRADQTFAIQ